MPKLLTKNRVKLIKISKDQPYIYYTETKPKQLEHKIMTNWAYIYTKYNLLKQYEQIVDFSTKEDYGFLKPDGFITIKNMFTNKYKFIFIETDLSNNNFDKIVKYNKLYSEKRYVTKSWHNIASGFPLILIITHRRKLVKNKIIIDNNKNLEFKVVDLDEVKIIPSK
jgi:hypothetical protein